METSVDYNPGTGTGEIPCQYCGAVPGTAGIVHWEWCPNSPGRPLEFKIASDDFRGLLFHAMGDDAVTVDTESLIDFVDRLRTERDLAREAARVLYRLYAWHLEPPVESVPDGPAAWLEAEKRIQSVAAEKKRIMFSIKAKLAEIARKESELLPPSWGWSTSTMRT